MLPKVLVMTTGGTIAMRYDPVKRGNVPAVCGKDLIEAVPPLGEICSPEVVEFANIPSFHMSPDIMLRLAQDTEKALSLPDVAGVVITHGTDTLEETAYFIDCCLAPEKPVCLVGALRSNSDISSDGPYNIYCAALAAVSPKLRGYGALIVMNGEIHAAAAVTKMYRSAVQAFASPFWGPVGHIDMEGIHTRYTPVRSPRMRVSPPLKHVPLLKVYTGMDTRLFDALLDMDMDGLVIEGYGLGNVPAAIIPGIERVLRKGIPVVASSRVPVGRTLGAYVVEGGAGHLRSLGVILSGSLSSQKARIKLMLALGLTDDPEKVAAYFAEP